jgi:hypothetical protein
LGYVLCPSFEGWHDVRNIKNQAGGGEQLVEIDAASHLDALMNLYTGYHGAAPLSIARDKRYWKSLLQRQTDDQFYALVSNEDNSWMGYLCLSQKGPAWRITDFALADQSIALHDQLYASALALAAQSGAQRVGGWMPDIPLTRRLFDSSPRRTEITMIKSLSSTHPLDDKLIAATDRFCEIDHV